MKFDSLGSTGFDSVWYFLIEMHKKSYQFYGRRYGVAVTVRLPRLSLGKKIMTMIVMTILLHVTTCFVAETARESLPKYAYRDAE